MRRQASERATRLGPRMGVMGATRRKTILPGTRMTQTPGSTPKTITSNANLRRPRRPGTNSISGRTRIRTAIIARHPMDMTTAPRPTRAHMSRTTTAVRTAITGCTSQVGTIIVLNTGRGLPPIRLTVADEEVQRGAGVVAEQHEEGTTRALAGTMRTTRPEPSRQLEQDLRDETNQCETKQTKQTKRDEGGLSVRTLEKHSLTSHDCMHILYHILAKSIDDTQSRSSQIRLGYGRHLEA